MRALFTTAVATCLVIACGSSGDSTFLNGEEGSSTGGLPPPGQLGGGGSDGGGAVVGSTDCKPKTCAEQGIECGPAGDGCGGIIPDCGKCSADQRCGGPATPSKCVALLVATACTPKTCADQGIECGLSGDGCGGTITCPACPSGQQCGANGTPSKCVTSVALASDGGTCVPKTCADYKLENKDCGSQSDGCGATIECGVCIQPEFCGGGGPSKCAISGGGTCTPKTCADFPGKCGAQSNGCGGVTANCGVCTGLEVCGGGGVPSVCGGAGATSAEGGTCAAITSCAAGQCGQIADGCGGTFDCGSPCSAGQVCGGAGVPNVCGAPICTPITTCPAGMNCGSVANGCGGTVSCGAACPAGQLCGAGGPNICSAGGVLTDAGTACVPAPNCAATGKECGPVADGCGGLVNCPACGAGLTCGLTAPSMCGAPTACVPRTAASCAGLGVNCGFIADGCGGPPVQCGATCPAGEVCGANSPNVCSGGGGGTCINFCTSVNNTCAAGSKTRLTGKVYAPNGTLPIPGALVYVPNGSLTTPYGVTPLTSGVSGAGTCDQCNQTASGSPLVSTTTAFDGSFTLDNVPAGIAFPIVIQLGKWRRMVTVPSTTACTARALTAAQTRLPTTQNEGNNNVDNIPLVGISTGNVDALECVFRKLGIADGQFGNPTGYTGAGGRIRLYHDNESGGGGNYKGGAVYNGSTPRTDSALTDSQAHLDQYDAVVFGCPGGEHDRSNTIDDRVRAYADKGGRVFATHFNYVYLYDRTPWDATIAWNPGEASSGNGDWTADIDTSPGKRLLFSQWLNAPGVTALSNVSPPQISINEARNDADHAVAAGAESWITKHNNPAAAAGSDADAVLHYTFNTPWGAPAANQCGRVLFSDFHVTVGSNTDGKTFPNECDANALSSQEKVLAFFLFDLTSCIATNTPTCTPKTCAAYPGICGVQSDGCGGVTANCNPCVAPTTCGGGGTPNVCGGSVCVAKTCAQLGAACGTVPNGCGGTVVCNPCTAPATCGGGGVAYQCGTPSCTAKTCANFPATCGVQGNGCGGVTPNCGVCGPDTTCGGGGVANTCGAPACTPITVCPAGKTCGDMPNGCGGSVHCGDCLPGSTCGGGGSANVCGFASCSPKDCAIQGAMCGSVSDQCGGVALCPVCPNGDFCNGQNVCVPPACVPKSCAQLGVTCGPVADSCGGLIDCGGCPSGQGCGAGGVAGQCGSNPCTPKSCTELGAVCGQVADGCGGLTPNCGGCAGSLSCKNGACVAACAPRTCASASAQCGAIADGCGSIVDCGPCPPGQECGYNNQANICGSGAPH